MSELSIAIEPPSFDKRIMKWWSQRMIEANHIETVINDKKLLMRKLHIPPGTAEHVKYRATCFSDEFHDNFIKVFGFDFELGYRYAYWFKQGVRH